MMFSFVPPAILPDGDHDRVEGVERACHRGLQRGAHGADRGDRVAGAVGGGAVPALAADGDVQLVGGGVLRAGPRGPDPAGDLGGVGVPGVRRVDPASGDVQESLGHHGLGAAGTFLAGLEHEHHVAGQVFPAADKMRAAPTRAPTWRSWPQACMTPGSSEAVVDADLLGDRQGVHVAAQQDHLPRAARGLSRAAHDRDDRGGALAEGDLEVEGCERLDDRLLGARQVVADLGVPVHLPAQLQHHRRQLAGQTQGLVHGRVRGVLQHARSLVAGQARPRRPSSSRRSSCSLSLLRTSRSSVTSPRPPTMLPTSE